MIVLTETTDNLQIVLGGSVAANQLRVMTSWRDITPTTYAPGRSLALTNNTTDVNIVPGPASSTQRVVDFLSIYNADTVSAVVTIKLDANGTEYELFKVTLATQERIEYVEGQGFKVFTNSGAIKNSLNQGNNPTTNSLNMAVLGADVINNNVTANTIANVTGLSFPVVAGKKYYFKFTIPYTSAATTTGSRWSISGPTFSILNYGSWYTLTATTETVNYASAYDTPAAANASSLAAGNVATIEGIIAPTANGDVIARFASEITNSAITAKAGAMVQWQEIA